LNTTIKLVPALNDAEVILAYGSLNGRRFTNVPPVMVVEPVYVGPIFKARTPERVNVLAGFVLIKLILPEILPLYIELWAF
jgi:hypothetical protein